MSVAASTLTKQPKLISVDLASAQIAEVCPARSGTACELDSLKIIGAAMPFARNAEIYGEDEPSEYLYKIVSGAVRTYKLLDDGRRQIGAFYLPGDVFGVETGDKHRFTAEAIVDSTIIVAKRSSLMSLADQKTDVARALWSLTMRELEHVQNLMLTLGRKNALERVVSFLLEMAQRNNGSNVIDLPMSRQDIADYLGLTIETVSRTFTQLEADCTIQLPSSRRVVLRNAQALRRLNS